MTHGGGRGGGDTGYGPGTSLTDLTGSIPDTVAVRPGFANCTRPRARPATEPAGCRAYRRRASLDHRVRFHFHQHLRGNQAAHLHHARRRPYGTKKFAVRPSDLL